MKPLLTVSALIEAPTGLAFLAVPALVFRQLFGMEIPEASVPLARLAGTALLALGVACWRASRDAESGAARAVVAAMLLYNLGAVVIFAMSGLKPPVGLAVWPAAVLHTGMAAWCARSLLR